MSWIVLVYNGLSTLPVTVTTRIIAFLVGNPYKPSFATVLLGGGTTEVVENDRHVFEMKLLM